MVVIVMVILAVLATVVVAMGAAANPISRYRERVVSGS
jgi:Na+-transporting methylmalonyl-CoA/oxaloacetate decarboxylase gamma subunit